MKKLFLLIFLTFTSSSSSSSICRKEFEETLCENVIFTKAEQLNLPSATTTNVLTIKKANGHLSKWNLANLGDSVMELKIIESALDEIEPAALCSPPNLTSINFINNIKIPQITRDLLKGCQHLKKINFDGSEIIVTNGAFSDCTNLQTLTLNETKMPDVVDKTTWLGLEDLKYLTVRHSHFNLNKDAFANLKSLKFLDLQDDQLDKIEDGTFANLNELKILNLSDNKLDLNWDEFDGLKNLKVLFLERNHFGKVDVDKLVMAVPNLERIFLSFNKLTQENRDKLGATLSKSNTTIIYVGKSTN